MASYIPNVLYLPYMYMICILHAFTSQIYQINQCSIEPYKFISAIDSISATELQPIYNFAHDQG